MTEPTPLKEHQTQLQATLIEALRDTWPHQKGLDALLFQNDLFYRLKKLEDLAEEENDTTSEPNGFLPADWGTFSAGRETYLNVWKSIDNACEPGDWNFVDTTEDLVVGWCTDMIPDRIAFFEAALETGSLDEAWMEKAELLREAHAPAVEEPKETPKEAVVPEPVLTLRPKSQPTRRRHDRLFTPSRAKPRVRNTRRHK